MPIQNEPMDDSCSFRSSSGSSGYENGDYEKEPEGKQKNTPYNKRKHQDTDPNFLDDEEDEDYESKSSNGQESSSEDSDSDFGEAGEEHHIYAGDVIMDRYKVLVTLGEGAYGRVVKAMDMTLKKEVALKIIKNKPICQEAAEYEINVLRAIAKLDPHKKSLCVDTYDWFKYHGQYCLSFEVLGGSVYDFMASKDKQPFPIDQIRHIAYQLCHAVNFLHKNKITHTDLKPENIMFVNTEFDFEINKLGFKDRRIRCTEIRLIDFGTAVFDDEEHPLIVTTRNYRAPEVILELGWSQPCDVWSIGCILFELYKGEILFKTHKNREHLVMMDRILGNIPRSMTRKSKTPYFKHGEIEWDEKSKDVAENCKPLRRYATEPDNSDHQRLFDLMYEMLEYIPDERIDLSKALKHRFFDKLPAYQRLT